MSEGLPVVRAADLGVEAPEERWLIQQLWGRTGVGFVAGHPKANKSWMALEIAISVASGTPCLGSFEVDRPGRALVYLAEDALPSVRTRIESLCKHRGLDIESLDLHVITAGSLRLDTETDQARLRNALKEVRPRLLVLDPLVRLHSLDENRSYEISQLLGYLRELQRTFDVAVLVVHHVTKKGRKQAGLALRGSGDLWAFADTTLYLGRSGERVVLSVEHRSSQPPAPITLQLVCPEDGGAIHLAIVDGIDEQPGAVPLRDRVVELLRDATQAVPGGAIRDRLKVNKQRLWQILAELQQEGAIQSTPRGWTVGQA